MKSLAGGIAAAVRAGVRPERVPAQAATQTPVSPYVGGSNIHAQLRSPRNYGGIYPIVMSFAERTSRAKWHLYRRSSRDDQDREEIFSHAALDLWNTPNPFFSRELFVETAQQHIELTGEMWWVVAYHPAAPKLPLELWPVRPDRMYPVPHPDKFLSGYVYHSPTGEQVPFELHEVICTRIPDPEDPYRGLSGIPSVITDLEGDRYSAQYARNFYVNSAEPGGVVELSQSLSDSEFRQLQERWNENHRGVSRAHRVAFLEYGKYVAGTNKNRDQQFVEVRAQTREWVRETFRFPRPILGTSTDINRSNAEAAQVIYGESINDKLSRLRGTLNNQFLKGIYGEPDLEFDFDSAVPADREAENRDLTTRATAAKKLIDAGFEHHSVCVAVGLPDIAVAAPPAPVGAPVPRARQHVHIVAAQSQDPERPYPEDVDLTDAEQEWSAAVDDAMAAWVAVTAARIASLVRQTENILASSTPDGIGDLRAPDAGGADNLGDIMVTLGDTSAETMAIDARRQGQAGVTAGKPSEDVIRLRAKITSRMLARDLETSAGREAIRLFAPGVTPPSEVAAAVREHLEGLSTATPERELGGALTAAQNAGRIATLKLAPEAAYYACEVMDKATCKNCRKVNKLWLGDLDQAEKIYPNGGFRDCLGGVRCRGTVVAVWRPEQVTGEE